MNFLLIFHRQRIFFLTIAKIFGFSARSANCLGLPNELLVQSQA